MLHLFSGLLLQAAFASDIYMRTNPDGSITFTDTPQEAGFRPFHARPLSTATRVVIRHLPRIDRYDALFLEASKVHSVPAELLKAVCLAESAMDAHAVSHAGAQGLMQLMPKTAVEVLVTDPFDPIQSIDGGARYLSWQLATFGEVAYALAAYNAGPTAVRKYGGIPPYPETQAYVEKVMAYYEHFQTRQPLVQ
jgi:soluble lytic murein transglycosylase-like protein